MVETASRTKLTNVALDVGDDASDDVSFALLSSRNCRLFRVAEAALSAPLAAMRQHEGLTGVSLSVPGPGVHFTTQNFTPRQQAVEGFMGAVSEIGTLQTSGAPLELTVDLEVDTNKASGWFSGDFVLFGGSPPSALSEALAPPSDLWTHP